MKGKNKKVKDKNERKSGFSPEESFEKKANFGWAGWYDEKIGPKTRICKIIGKKAMGRAGFEPA